MYQHYLVGLDFRLRVYFDGFEDRGSDKESTMTGRLTGFSALLNTKS